MGGVTDGSTRESGHLERKKKGCKVSTQEIKHGHGHETRQKREVSPEENPAENDPETWVVATRKEREAKPSIAVPLKRESVTRRSSSLLHHNAHSS
jgi:hypothetical protein